MPRVSYLNNSNGSLILEPQRSNAITNSESFGSTGWSFVTTGSAISPIVTDNYATSPDGTQNAQRIQFNLGGGSPSRTLIRQNLSTQTDWFLSVWMKSTNGTEQKVLWHSTSDTSETTVTGEWQRFELSRNGLSNSWAGLGLNSSVSTVDTADILVYGFQAEQGSYATTLINTQGSSVTRNADTCSITNVADRIGQTEGVIFVDFKKEHNGVETWSINDGTSQNRVYMGFNGTNFISQVRSSGGAAQASFTTSLSNNTRYKCALAYKLNDFVLYINGVQIGSDNSGVVPLSMSNLSANASTNSDAPFFSPTNDVKLYNTRLSNSELATLTTL